MKVVLILRPQKVWQRGLRDSQKGLCKCLCSAQEFCWSKTWQLSGFPQSTGHNLSIRNFWVKLSNLWQLSAKLAYTAMFPAHSSFYKEISQSTYLCMRSQTEILNLLTLLTANKRVPFSNCFSHSLQINKKYPCCLQSSALDFKASVTLCRTGWVPGLKARRVPALD